MEKGIFKGIFLTLGILSLFGVVFAVGFHTANEVISGNFLGNYSFNGKVDFTNASVIGNGSSSMITNWPDAIICKSGQYEFILTIVYRDSGSSLVRYRFLQNIASTADSSLVFNIDGTYKTQTNLNDFDCVGMSVQELYDAGQAFNLVGGFDNHKISCPTGFTSVESNGHQLGCMQDDEQSSSDCLSAISDCWNTYGGKLPSYNEIYISFENYNLNDESDDSEWIDVGYRDSTDFKCGLAGNTPKPAGATYSLSYAYRCFIPN